MAEGAQGFDVQENTKCHVHLPAHHESPSNRCRRILSGENRDGGRFGAHANTEKKARDKKLLPSGNKR